MPEAIGYGYHWIILGSVLYGSFGAFSGAVYGIMIPRESDKLISGDKEMENS